MDVLSDTKPCMCQGGMCWDSTVHTWGWRREALDASLSFAASSAGSGLWWFQVRLSSEQEQPRASASKLFAGRFCRRFEAGVYPLRSLSWSLQHFFLRWRLCLNWPRFTKQSIYACYVEINQSFFHGKSIIFSFTCLPMVIDRNTSRPGKHKAKSRRWAATPTPFFWHYDTESAPACTEIASENGAVGSNTCL